MIIYNKKPHFGTHKARMVSCFDRLESLIKLQSRKKTIEISQAKQSKPTTTTTAKTTNTTKRATTQQQTGDKTNNHKNNNCKKLQSDHKARQQERQAIKQIDRISTNSIITSQMKSGAGAPSKPEVVKSELPMKDDRAGNYHRLPQHDNADHGDSGRREGEGQTSVAVNLEAHHHHSGENIEFEQNSPIVPTTEPINFTTTTTSATSSAIIMIKHEQPQPHQQQTPNTNLIYALSVLMLIVGLFNHCQLTMATNPTTTTTFTTKATQTANVSPSAPTPSSPLTREGRQIGALHLSHLIQQLAGPSGTRSRWIQIPGPQSSIRDPNPNRRRQGYLSGALSRLSNRIGARNTIRVHNAFRDFAWRLLSSMNMPTPVIYELRRQHLYSPEDDLMNDSFYNKNTTRTVRSKRQLFKFWPAIERRWIQGGDSSGAGLSLFRPKARDDDDDEDR